jgi:hypothetical protein
VFSACTLLLGPISANRYDAAVTLLLALILLGVARGRWVLPAMVAGIGFALKITPALLLPLLLILAPRERLGRMLAGFSAAAGLPFLVTALLGGDAAVNLTRMFAYHADRPLEIESVLATPFWVGRLLGGGPVLVGLAAGSQVIASPWADLVARSSGVLLVVAVGAVFAAVWRRRGAIGADARLRTLAVLVTLLAPLVASKVLSPQYFIWLLPAIALVAVDRRLLGALLAVALLLTHVEFPANYWLFATDQVPFAIGIVVVRNVVLVAAFALALRHLWTIPATALRPARSDGPARDRSAKTAEPRTRASH